MQKHLPTFKEVMGTKTFDYMQQEIEDDRKKKLKKGNMGIEVWKRKYLYPFGDIAPICE